MDIQTDYRDPKWKARFANLSRGAKRNNVSLQKAYAKILALEAKDSREVYQLQRLLLSNPQTKFDLKFWRTFVQQKQQEDLERKEQEEKILALQQQQELLQNEVRNISTKKVVRNIELPQELMGSEESCPPAGTKVQVMLYDLGGKLHVLEVDLSTPIDDLFKYVFAQLFTTHEECRFMTGSKQLELGKTFWEQGVRQNTRINMLGRLKGGGKTKKSRRNQIGKKLGGLHAGFLPLARENRPSNDPSRMLLEVAMMSNEKELDELFSTFSLQDAIDATAPKQKSKKGKKAKAIPKEDSGDDIGEEDSERSGASSEYRYGDSDTSYVPSDEGDDDSDDADYCGVCGAPANTHMVGFGGEEEHFCPPCAREKLNSM